MELNLKKTNRLLSIWVRFKRNRMALFGCIIIGLIIILAIFAPSISPYDPYEIKLSESYMPPSGKHLFGTDNLGRDILSRVIWGARVSLQIGLIATTIMISLGVTVGLVSGYYGGLTDIILMRIVDIVLVMPTFFLYILAVSMLKIKGIFGISMIMGLLGWTSLARIVRGEVLTLKESDFIVAAKALGANDLRIILVHLLPNVMAPIIVTSTYRIASFILIESSLSYLGLGDPMVCSWGGILTRGRASLRLSPWISTFPGLFLFFTVLGFNLLGDGLRDSLDPKLKR